MTEPKRRSRPPKIKPVVVEEAHPVTDEVMVTYEDAGEEVELPEERLSPAQSVALDRDYDGDPGGSRPKASLTDLQREAYIRDAYDAYEGQFEVKRTDGFNRVWTFRHEPVKGHDHMLIRVDRGPTYSERHISTAHFTAQHAEAAIRDVDQEAAR